MRYIGEEFFGSELARGASTVILGNLKSRDRGELRVDVRSGNDQDEEKSCWRIEYSPRKGYEG